ncbi:MAG: DUF3473 domain-containing protein [Deltaproteobacteria bacterium]|nr:DUF3473 domain-containing protein [Candidatus Anaeroferrophillacea bacterium]
MVREPRILLTVDVEDWFQVENLRARMPPATWDGQELRVVDNTRRLLDLFENAAEDTGKPVRATFFVLGWVADRRPELVREIHARGHEVASHGQRHILCREDDPACRRADLGDSRKLLEDIIGAPVAGYRAPGFSIDRRVLDEIRAAGYRWDSSYNSFGLNERYGKVDFSACPVTDTVIQVADDFHEIPVSNRVIAGRTVPWAGGGYFRLYPPALFRAGIRRLLRARGAYVFYLHPWELDPGQPRVAGLPAGYRFRHYLNLHRTLPRLKAMIRCFADVSFITGSELVVESGSTSRKN